MRTILLSIMASVVIYSCVEISAKEANEERTFLSTGNETGRKPAKALNPKLRVGRNEANDMRHRRGQDDAAVKISARDLQALLTGPVNEKDSFIFYFVKYKNTSASDRDRYHLKVPGANWNQVNKKPSSLLVGFVPGDKNTTGFMNRRLPTMVDVYDLGVVCPPPPDCNCVISEFQ